MYIASGFDVALGGLDHYLTESHECVALVRHFSHAPPSSSWRQGAKVKGNTSLSRGTCIATFDANGHYANARSGNHAAIYLSQDVHGITVLDQWRRNDHY